MKLDYQLHPEIASTVNKLASYEGVEASVRTIRESRLSGGEAILIVIGFALSGFFGGLLSKAGEEFWSLLKELPTRLRQSNEPKKSYELVIYIRESSGASVFSFLYHVNLEDGGALDSFRDAAEHKFAVLKLGAQTTSSAISSLEYLADGRWKDCAPIPEQPE